MSFFFPFPADVTAAGARWWLCAACRQFRSAWKRPSHATAASAESVGMLLMSLGFLVHAGGGGVDVLSMFATINARNVGNARLKYAAVFAGCYRFVST